MTTAAKQIIDAFGPHLVRWTLERIRAGSMTPELFANGHGMQGCSLSTDTIRKGLSDLASMHPSDLPANLR